MQGYFIKILYLTGIDNLLYSIICIGQYHSFNTLGLRQSGYQIAGFDVVD